jgi:hypothetical protein
MNSGLLSWPGAGVGGGFPKGTKLLFQQTAAPLGWTKDVVHNDKALRVVSGAASSGGTNSFTTSLINAVTASSTTLSTAQLASHNHSHGHTANTGAGGSFEANGTAGTGTAFTGSNGSGTSHNHTVTLGVQYVDVIIATKD